ncbi:hypothetical protein [Larsenimonas suaedae]|uniref:Uncharacterized protein n=1 Tax=Larsenimonas suaedae TaxID=1851019 RepID=A0ABU1GZ71_9GAMM|nr:hypothetical protein [Larsenimonas suaedae]MCM2973472.1 hypothetical protein [Larsenimonas suaedae]MDR5897352.1 hypothetical protein [Larsenimonas suaedae]
MTHLDTTNAATAFLLTLPRPVAREDAVARCCAHLMTEHDQTRDNASILALQAYAELEAVNRTAWIDLDASTASLLVIRQSGGPIHALTLGDLLRLKATAEREIKVAPSTTH